MHQHKALLLSAQTADFLGYEIHCQVVPSVGVMLFALPVGGDNIWPIDRVISWENHGYLLLVTSWHTLQIWFYIWPVEVSH